MILNWFYKLGTGQRHEGVNGKGLPITAFTPEKKDVGAFFKLETDVAEDGSDTILYLHCSMDGWGDPPTLDEFKSVSERSLEDDYKHAAEIRSKFSLSGQPEISGAYSELGRAILARIAGVTRFKVAVSYNGSATALIPTAGAWWFKTPWFRDTFEGILNSFQVLMSLPEGTIQYWRGYSSGALVPTSRYGTHPESFSRAQRRARCCTTAPTPRCSVLLPPLATAAKQRTGASPRPRSRPCFEF